MDSPAAEDYMGLPAVFAKECLAALKCHLEVWGNQGSQKERGCINELRNMANQW